MWDFLSRQTVTTSHFYLVPFLSIILGSFVQYKSLETGTLGLGTVSECRARSIPRRDKYGSITDRSVH
jgi:hypothetical protein